MPAGLVWSKLVRADSRDMRGPYPSLITAQSGHQGKSRDLRELSFSRLKVASVAFRFCYPSCGFPMQAELWKAMPPQLDHM